MLKVVSRRELVSGGGRLGWAAATARPRFGVAAGELAWVGGRSRGPSCARDGGRHWPKYFLLVMKIYSKNYSRVAFYFYIFLVIIKKSRRSKPVRAGCSAPVTSSLVDPLKPPGALAAPLGHQERATSSGGNKQATDGWRKTPHTPVQPLTVQVIAVAGQTGAPSPRQCRSTSTGKLPRVNSK